MVHGRVVRVCVIGPLSGALALFLSSSAFADEPQPATDTVPAETATTSADAQDVADIREEAAEDREDGDESASLQNLREEVAESAAESGETLLAEDTEAFELSDDVQIAFDSDVVIDSVEVVIYEDRAVAEVVADVGDDDASDQGQGMGWDVKSSGTYIIKLTGKGEMESRFIKSRYEGSDAPDLSSMRRKAMGRGYDIWGQNWSVTGLYISSHVKDSDRQWVNGRWANEPASDDTGNCDGSPLNLDIKFLSWSFDDCDEIDIAWSADNPGYYRAYMKQGSVFKPGDREVGFHNVIKVDSGRDVYYSHYQVLEMARWTYPAHTCASWTSNETC